MLSNLGDYWRPMLYSVLVFLLTTGFVLRGVPLTLAQIQETEFGIENFVTEYPLSSDGANAFAIFADPFGRIWFSQRNLASIAYLDPMDGGIQEFAVPTDQSTLEIWSIYVNDNNEIWFTDATEHKIRMLDLKTGIIIDHLIPSVNATPWDIKGDHDGNLWFTEFGDANNLAKIIPGELEPGTQKGIIEYQIPTPLSRPSYIEIDESGKVWFVESGPGKIAKFDPETETFTEYTLPGEGVGGGTVNPIGLSIDKDGKIWYTQFRTSIIGRLDPISGEVTEYATGALTSGTFGMTKDSTGDIWTIQFRADRVVRISPEDLKIWEYKIPSDRSFAQTITSDNLGNVWFIERDNDKIGVIDGSKSIPFTVEIDSRTLTLPGGGHETLDLLVTSNGNNVGEVFLIARGNTRVTGFLSEILVTFSPERFFLDGSNESHSEIDITLGENLEPKTYQITLGASDLKLELYTGLFVELEVREQSSLDLGIIALVGAGLALLLVIIAILRSKR